MHWLEEQVAEYYRWLKSKTHTLPEKQDEWALISTPFPGLFNDTLEIYAKRGDNGQIILSDDGKSLRDLNLVGVSISRSPARKEMVDNLLVGYGVTMRGDEIIAKATDSNFHQKKHDMLQAMLELSNFYVLSKPTVSKAFKDDVREYLDEQEIIYTPEFISRGIAGIEFVFDFQIAYRNQEIVIKSFNRANKIYLSSFLFAWKDVKKYRENATGKNVVGLAIFNDENKPFPEEYIHALEKERTGYMLWGERYKSSNVAKLKDAA